MSCCEPPEKAFITIESTDKVVRFDSTNLGVGLPNRRFNSSIARWEDGFLFAYRDGWGGSSIYLARLNNKLEPIEVPRHLFLNHRKANFGREDPRLFWHNGQLHIAFIGVYKVGGEFSVSQLYARLSPSLKAEGVWLPVVPNRRYWEKNHSYFSHDGKLYAIYTVDPGHRILKIDGAAAEFVYETATPRPWSGGEQRGGAAPVQVGEEFWHFTHSHKFKKRRQCYEIGLYTFDAFPPFKPRRIIPEPIMIGTQIPQPDPPNYADAVFPCGAVLDGDSWLVSMGIHDSWSEIRRFGFAELESRLVAVD